MILSSQALHSTKYTDIPLHHNTSPHLMKSYRILVVLLFPGWANIVSENMENNLNFLWRLYLPTLTWTLLFPNGTPPFPCDKAACWVHNNR